MLPKFLVVGAQKAGSSFALNCLAEHPDIYMPPYEVKFFEDPTYLHSEISDLEALFEHVTAKQVPGIKRPGYLGRPECAARIHYHIPAAKLIVILRDPISRAVSAYFHSMNCSFIPLEPIEEGMTKILEGEYQDRYPRAQEITEFGLYYQHLSRYLDYFERSQLMILLFDSIKAAPLESIQKLYRFVGVDPTYIPQALNEHSQKNPGLYSLARIRFQTLCNPLIYTYYNNRTRRDRKPKTLFQRVVQRAVSETDRLLLSPIYGNAKPELSLGLKSRLFEIYEEDIAKLEELLEEELPKKWKLQVPESIH